MTQKKNLLGWTHTTILNPYMQVGDSNKMDLDK